jgi:UDP-N-acetylmuramate dehydrogenase
MTLTFDKLPSVRGRLTENADIAKGTWFRVGGLADVLFKPTDVYDLAHFLKNCPRDIPITMLGLCSNMIIRDGGIRGVVIKFGRNFATISHDDDGVITAGSAALDMNVARYGAENGLGGLEFLSGIPGSIGGALRMNAGAYGAEVKDVLIDCHAIDRNGDPHVFTPTDMGLSYRHNDLSPDYIFTSARFKTTPESSDIITQRIGDIRDKRHDTQPVKARTGGSTFANPTGHKSWKLIDSVGGRGLTIGGASMSEKHCNFMLNSGDATAQDLEDLGEEIRRRVMDKHGIDLRWEIKRIGEFAQ